MIRRTLGLIVAAALAACLALPASAYAKSYTTGPVDIQAQLEPTGDMTVTEQRTFGFDGDFTFVFWRIPKKGGAGLEVLSVNGPGADGSTSVPYEPTDDPGAADSRPPGRYLVTDTGDAYEIRAFHRTSNQDATFTLQYRVKSAVSLWEDTAELYWQFIGDGWDIPASAVTVEIKPPAPLSKADVRAWAHGPLTGNVAIGSDGVVTLDVAEVPANTFVEARVLYPPSAFPQAQVAGGPKKDQIMAEEAALAEDANATRRQARGMVWAGAGLSGLLALVGLGIATWAFFRFGREHKAQFPGGYFREDPRPDLHPAVAGALWRFGKVTDADIAATLMDLADKGVIVMQPVNVSASGLAGAFGKIEQSYQLTIDPQKRARLGKLDEQLVALLFDEVGSGGTFTLDQLKSHAKAHPQSFSESVQAWKDAASGEAEALGFFEPDSKTAQVLTFVGAGLVLAGGIFAAFATGFGWALCLPVPCAIVMAGFGAYMNRRSRAGNELFRQYEALRNFLRDFSRLEEAPPASVVLWNRFLVLAVVFGIAEEVIEQLRVKMPQVVQDPSFQTSYWWAYGGPHGSPVSQVSQSFVSAASIASSQMSSASGGGGGFSGGGGFGGGGGGGGAG